MKPTFLLLSALLFAPLTHAATTPISGIVRDGSKGGRPMPNAPVQLIRPGDKGAKKVLQTVRTDATGRFTFPAKEWGDDDLLMANVPHQGYDYAAVAYDGGDKLKAVGMNVNPTQVDVATYDTTTKNVPLQYQVHHLAIKSTATGLNVIERIVVINPTEKTFLGIGPRRVSVLLNVPKGATDVALDPKTTDAKLIKTTNGYGIERPITPQSYGARNAIIVSYNIDWPSKLPWAKKIDLSREIAYPTQFFFVARLPDDKNLEVEAPLLSSATEAELPIDGETEVRIVNSIGAPQMPGMPGGDKNDPVLAAGSPMSVVIERPVNPLFWAFAAMTLGLIVFLPVAMIKPRRDRNAAATDAATPVGAAMPVGAGAVAVKSAEPRAAERVKLPASAPGAHDGATAVPTAVPMASGEVSVADLTLTPQAQMLIAQIAQLDDEREAGRIEAAEYQARRAQCKAQLIEKLNG